MHFAKQIFPVNSNSWKFNCKKEIFSSVAHANSLLTECTNVNKRAVSVHYRMNGFYNRNLKLELNDGYFLYLRCVLWPVCLPRDRKEREKIQNCGFTRVIFRRNLRSLVKISSAHATFYDLQCVCVCVYIKDYEQTCSC